MRKILRGLGMTIVCISMFGGYLLMSANRHGEYVSVFWVLPYAIATLGSMPFMLAIEKICDKHWPE